MANSLLTGISGLRGHQKMLEVIGNNLANVNTPGFKSARTLFSDLMYDQQRGASSGTEGVLGSINPLQVGTGSKISSVDLNFTQGNLESTSEPLDAAIDGGGFFVANNGTSDVYTRKGAFSLDENGYLEDPATGFLIQRFGTVGENDINGVAFQTNGDSRIRVPIGASLPGMITENLTFSGQLGASATGPTNRLLRSMELSSASTGTVTPTTLLNDLDSTQASYVGGDQLRLSGEDLNGASLSAMMAVDGTTTVQDLINALQTMFGTDATISFNNSAIEIESTQVGPTELNLTIEDDPANTGSSNSDFQSRFEEVEPGRNATAIEGSFAIHDERGAQHPLSYELEKQVDGSWTLSFSLDAASGTLVDDRVEGIRFGSDGSLSQVTGTGNGDQNISVMFAGSSLPQTINIDLGTFGEIDGLAEIGGTPQISYNVDGSDPGELASVQIDADGTVQGIGSNGTKFALAQLAIASFRNVDGLIQSGSGYYSTSLASGNPELGTALSGDRGSVRSGQLEGSNVDLALEFTRLLVAQRGFSANARTITVTDEVLEELTNIIR